MIKPYDATMRELFEPEPAAWSDFLGFPAADPALVQVVDSNLSGTMILEADKVIRIGGDHPLILHIEFLSSRDLGYPGQLLWYNEQIGRKHGPPVWSVLILLRRAADGPELTGEYVREVPGRGRNAWFRYDVVRVWKLPSDRLLTGGLPLLPLAPVSDVAPERLPEVLTAVARRLRDEAKPALMKMLWWATEILLGLRYPREQVAGLIQGVENMNILKIRGIEESWVYQDILAKGVDKGRAEGEAKGLAEGEARGRAEEARTILLRLGRKRLGVPDERALAQIEGTGDLDRLDALLDRVLDVSTWEELLAPAGS